MKKVIAEMRKMTDVDFMVLEHHFSIARMIRDVMSRRGLSNKEMADVLGISILGLKNALMAAYPFDLMILSKLQTYQQKRAAEDAKFKIETESIGFSHYKHQLPIIWNQMKDAIDDLKKLNKEQAVQESDTRDA